MNQLMNIIKAGSYLCSAEVLDKNGNVVNKPSGIISFKNNGTWDELKNGMLQMAEMPKNDFGVYITLFVALRSEQSE